MYFLTFWYPDQRAIWCIQLERLYHQRLLDNLSALQKQWGNDNYILIITFGMEYLHTIYMVLCCSKLYTPFYLQRPGVKRHPLTWKPYTWPHLSTSAKLTVGQ